MLCPKCGGRLKVKKSPAEHPLSTDEVNVRRLKCDKCKFTDETVETMRHFIGSKFYDIIDKSLVA
jgi:C4-type Zn-finger protein